MSTPAPTPYYADRAIRAGSRPFDALIGRYGSAVTLYDSDGVSNPRQTTALISNSVFVRMLGSERGNVIMAHFSTGLIAQVGQVLQAAGVQPAWFIAVKTLIITDETALPFSMGQTAALIAIPFSATVSRESAAQKAGGHSVWGSPLGATESGEPVSGTAESHTIKVGYSNSFDPLDDQVIGPLPKTGNVTAYTPLGSNVRTGDSLALPDGRPARVGTASTLYADGLPYALQLLLDLSSGSGLTPGTPT